jgi:hypothetical protein
MSERSTASIGEQLFDAARKRDLGALTAPLDRQRRNRPTLTR